jgi:hypothetical protein
MRPGAVALAALLLACAPVRAAAPVADGAAAMLAVPPPRRPNAEMAADILDLAFETEGGRDVSRLLRFEGPIRVRLAGRSPRRSRPTSTGSSGGCARRRGSTCGGAAGRPRS